MKAAVRHKMASLLHSPFNNQNLIRKVSSLVSSKSILLVKIRQQVEVSKLHSVRVQTLLRMSSLVWPYVFLNGRRFERKMVDTTQFIFP
jgi:hypothetical protein